MGRMIIEIYCHRYNYPGILRTLSEIRSISKYEEYLSVGGDCSRYYLYSGYKQFIDLGLVHRILRAFGGVSGIGVDVLDDAA